MRNEIPTIQRAVVKVRDEGKCVRCGGVGSEWHHRRSRSVRDEHQHCACNGVWLCRTCHAWAHAHPFEARRTGFIVSRHSTPVDHPVECVMRGWVRLTCMGRTEFVESPISD
jgi:hypothetical protein